MHESDFSESSNFAPANEGRYGNLREVKSISFWRAGKIIEETYGAVDQDTCKWHAFIAYSDYRFAKKRFEDAKGYMALRAKEKLDEINKVLEREFTNSDFTREFLKINELARKLERRIALGDTRNEREKDSDTRRVAENIITDQMHFARYKLAKSGKLTTSP